MRRCLAKERSCGQGGDSAKGRPRRTVSGERVEHFFFLGPFFLPPSGLDSKVWLSAMRCRLALDGQVEQDLVDLTPDQKLLPAYRPHPLSRSRERRG